MQHFDVFHCPHALEIFHHLVYRMSIIKVGQTCHQAMFCAHMMDTVIKEAS